MLYIVPIHHVQCPRSLKCWTPHQRVNEYELFLCRILLYVFWRSDLLWCWIMMLSFIVSNAGGFSSLCLLQDYYRAIIHSTGWLRRLTLMNWIRVKVRFHHPILWLGFSGEIFELSEWCCLIFMHVWLTAYWSWYMHTKGNSVVSSNSLILSDRALYTEQDGIPVSSYNILLWFVSGLVNSLSCFKRGPDC